MKNKFTIGSQWKTRGGLHAVVVGTHEDGGFIVWHSNAMDICLHFQDGKYTYGKHYDLIEPWQEPQEGKLWVNVYQEQNIAFNVSAVACHSLDRAKENSKVFSPEFKTIARVKVPWKEGQFDE